MTGPSYGPQVLSHYLHPHNVGSLDPRDPGVGTALVGSPQLGQVLKLQIRVHGDTIDTARFRAFGCGAMIACGSLATRWLQGRTLEQARAIHSQDFTQALDLPAEKLHCALLAQDAIRAAIEDYAGRQPAPAEASLGEGGADAAAGYTGGEQHS